MLASGTKIPNTLRFRIEFPGACSAFGMMLHFAACRAKFRFPVDRASCMVRGAHRETDIIFYTPEERYAKEAYVLIRNCGHVGDVGVSLRAPCSISYASLSSVNNEPGSNNRPLIRSPC